MRTAVSTLCSRRLHGYPTDPVCGSPYSIFCLCNNAYVVFILFWVDSCITSQTLYIPLGVVSVWTQHQAECGKEGGGHCLATDLCVSLRRSRLYGRKGRAGSSPTMSACQIGFGVL